jgi:hypothetical protein
MTTAGELRVTIPSGVTRVTRPPGMHHLVPPALAPLGEVQTLGADRGVLAVAGMDPRVVRQRAEQPCLDVVDEAGEPDGVLLRVAHPAGEAGCCGRQEDRAAPSGATRVGARPSPRASGREAR